MKGYIKNIEDAAKENSNFRKVLYTAKLSQLVVMSLKAGEDIGMEVHDDTDQFIRIEQGRGKAILDGVETPIEDNSAIVIPSGAEHNIVNESDEEMKLYTIYSPAHHRHDVVHATKEEAEADDEHFDGTTTE